MTTGGSREYRRLPGRGVGLFRTTTLWAAEDHLLLVDVRGFSEFYRRFYFGDVQAVALCPTPVGRVRAVALALLGVSLAALGWTCGPAWKTFWWTLAAMVVVLLLVDLGLGPSCICTLQTAAQTVDVLSLRRLRRARWFTVWVQPHVELAQGALKAAEVLERSGETGPAAAAPAASIPPTLATPPAVLASQRPLRHESGRIHELMCYALLLSVATTTLQLFVWSVMTSVVASVIGVGVLALVIASVVRQQGSDVRPGLKRLAWTVIAFEAVLMVSGFVYGAFVMFRLTVDRTIDPSTGPFPFDVIRKQPGYRTLALVSAGGALLLAAWGLVLIRNDRREKGARAWQSPGI